MTFGLMSVLCVIAFGFKAPAELFWAIVTIPFCHPAETWLAIRIIAGFMFFSIIFAAIASWLDDGRIIADPSRAEEIQSFRLKNPFGDATLAERHEIAEALTGSRNGLSPQFED